VFHDILYLERKTCSELSSPFSPEHFSVSTMKTAANVKTFNVVIMCLANMHIVMAFNTMGNIQATVLNSARDSKVTGYVPGFDGTGYTLLAIIFSVNSVACWIAPVVYAAVGTRMTMSLSVREE
jgi:hypothetical protein